ncbi:MAG: DUF2161 domain-containing phosphodiesterase [Armatimonadaceae bacterium]
MMRTKRESDLAQPVTEYLCANGYTVRSEVLGCDVTAVKDDELIVVELKRSFSVDLLFQATDRQQITDSVYVAVPAEAVGAKYSKKRRSVERLVKRLELGLLLVHATDPDAPELGVEVVLHPISEPRPRKKPRKRRAVLKEIAERSADYNIAGQTRRPVLTAYRERAIQIAALLHINGSLTPAALRAQGTGPKTQSILNRNVYGWFERVDRGIYALRPRVWETLQEMCAPVVARFVPASSEAIDSSPD